jgi:hypothetical protein
MGTPYSLLRTALKEIQQILGIELRGYGDMSVEEIAARTGLSLKKAHLSWFYSPHSHLKFPHH